VYGELSAIEQTEFRFFIERPVFTTESVARVTWKDAGKVEAVTNLTSVLSLINDIDFSSTETTKAGIMPYAEAHGKGNVLWPLRMALSGQEKSVDPFTICYVLGKDEVITRIKNAITVLNS
jgi:glutamyl/glutaminyl-tRNA synthetase